MPYKMPCKVAAFYQFAALPDFRELREPLRASGARLGLMRPVALVTSNLIGLRGEARIEKRRIHGSAPHAHGSAEEVAYWPATSDQAAEAELPPQMPVAVVTAGAERSTPWLKAIQAVPALASRQGYVEHVAGARHASLLGPRFADAVVRGVQHVLHAAPIRRRATA